MKTAEYRLSNGNRLFVTYDENAPCFGCGEPVCEASVGGPGLCPACDCGYNRDGTRKTTMQNFEYKREQYFLEFPENKTTWTEVSL